jgi:hypothetical protein
MPAINLAECQQRYAKLPVCDLWSCWQVAELTGSAEAAFAHRAYEERLDPKCISGWALARDAVRTERVQMYQPPGGHWKCIRSKSNAVFVGSFRKTDWRMISALVALASFVAYWAWKLATAD